MAIPSSAYAHTPFTNPLSDLTDYVGLIDLSLLPQAWWDEVTSSNGERGRLAKGDGVTELASEWVEFDSVNQTGWVWFKHDGTLLATGDQKVQVYPPQTGNTAYLETDTFGRNAVWSDYDYVSHMNTLPLVDSSGNISNATTNGTPDVVAGKIGNAIYYNGDGTEYSSIPDMYSTDNNPLQIQFWVKPSSITTDQLYLSQGADWDTIAMGVQSGEYKVYISSSSSSARSGASILTAGQWSMLHMLHDDNGSNTSRVWENGSEVTYTETTTATSDTSLDSADWVIAHTEAFWGDAEITMAELRFVKLSKLLSDEYKSYEHTNQDNPDTFWGTWQVVDPSDNGFDNVDLQVYPAQGTSEHTFNIPSDWDIERNDLLMVFVSSGTSSVYNPQGVEGWKVGYVHVPNINNMLACYYKKAKGNEAGQSLNYDLKGGSSVGEAAIFMVTHKKQWNQIQFEDIISTTSSTPTPPSITPSWGAKEGTMFGIMVGKVGNATVNSYPTGYDSDKTEANQSVVGETSFMAIASRIANVTTETPSAWDIQDGGPNTLMTTFAIEPEEQKGTVGGFFTITSDSVKWLNESHDNAYFDLSQAPSGFWNSVSANGGNVRVYHWDGSTERQVPREVIGIDTGLNEGQLFFGSHHSLASTANEWRVYVETDKSEPPEDSKYGRNSVWIDYYLVAHLNDLNVVDSSGNVANGAVTGAVTVDNSPIGKGLDIGFATEEVRIPIPFTSPPNKVTFSKWVYPKTGSGIFEASTPNGTSFEGWTEGRPNGDLNRFYVEGASSASYGQSNHGVIANQWSYVVNVYDADDIESTLKPYINNQGLNLAVSTQQNITSDLTGFQIILAPIDTRFSSYDGLESIFAEYRLRNGKIDDNYRLTEYEQQLNNSSFWTVSTWDSGEPSGDASGGSTATLLIQSFGEATKSIEDGAGTQLAIQSFGDGFKGLEGGNGTQLNILSAGQGTKSVSGGSSTPIAIVSLGGGTVALVGAGGSTAVVGIDAFGSGSKQVNLGSAGILDIAPTGEGQKSVSLGSSSVITIEAVGVGQAFVALQGGSVAVLDLSATGVGKKTGLGGSSTQMLIDAFGSGEKMVLGGSSVILSILTESAGFKTVSDGSEAQVLIATAADGRKQILSGAQAQVLIQAFAGGEVRNQMTIAEINGKLKAAGLNGIFQTSKIKGRIED